MFSRALSYSFSLILGARKFVQISLLLLVGVGFFFGTSQPAFALNPEAYWGFVIGISTGDYGAGLTGNFGASGLSTGTSINIRNNQLTGFDPTGFPSLTSLDISGNLLSSFDDGSGLPNLTTLNLNSNPNLSSIAFTNGNLTSFSGAY